MGVRSWKLEVGSWKSEENSLNAALKGPKNIARGIAPGKPIETRKRCKHQNYIEMVNYHAPQIIDNLRSERNRKIKDGT
mgnify:CR=1 FL=1